MILWAILCSFRRKVPSGPVIDSDDEHDDRDEHDLDDLPNLEDILPNLEDIVQPAVVQPAVDIVQPVQPAVDRQPHDMFYLSPPPPLPTQPPTQTVTLEEVFSNFRSVLNLQLIPDDERNTDAAATARVAIRRLQQQPVWKG
jgi:hypothetical protein